MSTPDNKHNVQSAYTTTGQIGQLNKVNSIARSIESLLIINKNSENLKQISGNVVAVIGDVEHIPTFLHPIIHNDHAYIDVRNQISKDGSIRNIDEYALMVRRAKLDLAWSRDKSLFYSQEKFVIDAFSSWFSYGLGRSTNASLATIANYRAISAIYYLGLFNDQDISEDEDVEIQILKQIPRIIRIPDQIINDLFTLNQTRVIELFRNGNSNDPSPKIHQLARVLSIVTNEETTIEPSIIYNALCRGAYIGTNTADVTAIGLELPSTFIAMLSCIMKKGLQNNTTLGKAVLGVSRNHNTNFDKFLADISPVE